MVEWKKIENIIISIDCIIEKDLNTSSYKLVHNSEKLLFNVLNASKGKLKYYLISDLETIKLQSIIELLGLNFFFDYMTSSETVGFKTNTLKFWEKYCSTLNIMKEKTLLLASSELQEKVAVDAKLQEVILLDKHYTGYLTNLTKIVPNLLANEKALETA